MTPTTRHGVMLVFFRDWLQRYGKSTTSRSYWFDLLWICRGLAGGFRFVVQHLDMSRCCGFVVDARFVVDLLWTRCGFVVQLSICCGFVVDLLYSLLYNKSTTNRISGV